RPRARFPGTYLRAVGTLLGLFCASSVLVCSLCLKNLSVSGATAPETTKLRRESLRGLHPGSTAKPCCDIFDSLNQGAYPFVAGQRRAGASDQSPDTPRLFGGRKISNPNFCSIHVARRRQNNRTTSRPHFGRNTQNVTGLRSNGRRQGKK